MPIYEYCITCNKEKTTRKQKAAPHCRSCGQFKRRGTQPGLYYKSCNECGKEKTTVKQQRGPTCHSCVMHRRKGKPAGKPAWNTGLIGFRLGYKHADESRILMSLVKGGKGDIEFLNRPPTVFYRSKAGKHWAKSVKTRDNYTCQYCHSVGGSLNSHHILSRGKHPEFELSINNGITLCVACHKQEHKINGNI